MRFIGTFAKISAKPKLRSGTDSRRRSTAPTHNIEKVKSGPATLAHHHRGFASQPWARENVLKVFCPHAPQTAAPVKWCVNSWALPQSISNATKATRYRHVIRIFMLAAFRLRNQKLQPALVKPSCPSCAQV